MHRQKYFYVILTEKNLRLAQVISKERNNKNVRNLWNLIAHYCSPNDYFMHEKFSAVIETTHDKTLFSYQDSRFAKLLMSLFAPLVLFRPSQQEILNNTTLCFYGHSLDSEEAAKTFSNKIYERNVSRWNFFFLLQNVLLCVLSTPEKHLN